MRFFEFSYKLRQMGASMEDIYRLDHEGRKSAEDAHRDMWEEDFLQGIVTENDFHSFCAYIGRDFVLDNIGYDGAPFSIRKK